MVIDLVNSGVQFQGLSGPIGNFLDNLQSTTVTATIVYTDHSGVSRTVTVSNMTLEQVLITHTYAYVDSTGTTYNVAITPAMAGIILHDNLTPSPPNPYVPPPVPTPTPTPNTPPNTEILQGIVANITQISGAISSSSTQTTTSASQVEQQHQAIIKMATAVVDPKNGLMAINNNAVTRQVTS